MGTVLSTAKQRHGRLAQLVTGSLQNETISSYDAVGNPTGIGYSDHTSESFAASYNEWDQLTAYGSLEGYGYIPAGQQDNIGTLQTKGAASYGYPAPGQPRPHAASSVSGVGSYGYDANGNRASDANSTYTYDVENRLSQLVQGGTTVLGNTFDGDGARLARVANGVTTHFIGDAYEVNPATGAATAYYPFGGVPVAMKAGSTLSFLDHDHLGSLVSATNAGGAELGWARYFPFGALRLSGGTLPSDRLFTGQTRDLGDDRRYWFQARAYDATIGQFQIPDTALPDLGKTGPANPQTSDRYAYALNTPLRAVDPSGHAALVGPGWEGRFEAAHGGQAPSQQDQQDYLFTLGHPGTGYGGAWTDLDWSLFSSLRQQTNTQAAEAVWPEVAKAEQTIQSTQPVSLGSSLGRTSDYTTVTINANPDLPVVETLFGGTLQVVKDYYGRWYIGVGGNAGKGLTLLSGSVTGGWVQVMPERPTPQYLHDFLVQVSVSAGLGAGPGAGVTWGNVGHFGVSNWARDNGFYSPQAGVSVTYTWQVQFSPFPF